MSPDELIQKYIGGKYEYKGRATGLDCYGLVWRIYQDIGIDLPDLSFSDDNKWHMKGVNLDVSSLAVVFQKQDTPKKFDLVAFFNARGIVNHAGVYIGDGKFIHATSKAGVICSLLADKMWMDRLAGIYRHKDLK